MDLYAAMLAAEYAKNHSAEVHAVQLRPYFNRRFTRLPCCRGNSFLWNADRLINRFHDYQVWLEKQIDRFDIFDLIDHSYAQLVPELPKNRVVVHLHDLDTFRCLLEPEREPRPYWFRAMAQRILDGLKQAAYFICNSHWTRTQVVRYGIAREDRVGVMYPGVNTEFFCQIDSLFDEQTPSIIAGTERLYLLHVGSTIPRKRIDILLRIFALISKEVPDVLLVRVGAEFTTEQSRLVSTLGIEGKVIIMPSVSVSTLKAIYSRATVLLQTSDAEGFGLPVIEAMACGCPVVVSDLPVLREAGGTAAEYCPVGETDAWRRTVLALLREQETEPERWAGRRVAARRQAAMFTWSNHVREAIRVYRQILEATPVGN
jgi:glycosyltransferase involved in cell wall biosynthesis